MNPPLAARTSLHPCLPDRREGSAFPSPGLRPLLPLEPRFLLPSAPFPILVPFVFNHLRTLLQLSGGGGYQAIFGFPSSRFVFSTFSFSFACHSYRLFHAPYPLTPLFATLTQTAGVSIIIFPEWNAQPSVDFAHHLRAYGWSQKKLPNGRNRP